VSATYNCEKLLTKGSKYYDTVSVKVTDGSGFSTNFEYLVVCDSAKLRGFDINFLVLFGIAVLVLVIVIKTPPFLVFNEMSPQEQEQTDLKLSSAVCFFFAASCMLFILYMFMDYLKDIFTVLIMISCIGCASIIIEDLLIQGLKPSREDFLRREIKFPIFGPTSNATLIGTIIGIVIAVSWFFTHNWVLNNVLAILLAITFLKTLRLTTMVPGLLLLGLLFFYDIFWVFLSPMFTSGGQSVMVVVATGLDIPIKLVMPHLTQDYPT
jgi:hypothetical protein